MTTPTLTLTDFLLARIAEDEALAQAAHRESMRGHAGPGYARSIVAWAAQAKEVRGYELIERMTPARVLAECEAKRRIVDVARYATEGSAGWGFRRILLDLATVYADHPDFRKEWRA